ncbi:MAG: hypothetical protein WAJ88_14475 [Pseudolabrys sp.]
MAPKRDARAKRSIAGSAIALLLSALPYAPANAAKAPYDGCVAVTRQEYNAAKKQHLLRTRFTQYVRTGIPGRRHYWYCR